MDISSRSNPLIVDVCKLKNKKYRDESGRFFFEGHKLFEEAVKNDVSLLYVFSTDHAAQKYSALIEAADCEIVNVSDSVYEKLTEDHSPDGIFCVAKKNDRLHSHSVTKKTGAAIVLCDIQDAGNLGTCLRSALSFDIETVYLTGNCADIYNTKCIRSSMGAVFAQPTVSVSDPVECVDHLHEIGKTVYAAALYSDSVELNKMTVGKDTVFAVGNEGHGLPNSMISACDGSVIIPMSGKTESLNAAVASSILMWQTFIAYKE